MKIKKIVIIAVISVFTLPISVKANILCNDGTHSPTCQDCHQGCCSHHGGCATNYSYEDYDEYEDDDYENDEDYNDDWEDDSDNEEYYEDGEKEEDSDSGILELGVVGLICYFVYAVIKK